MQEPTHSVPLIGINILVIVYELLLGWIIVIWDIDYHWRSRFPSYHHRFIYRSKGKATLLYIINKEKI